MTAADAGRLRHRTAGALVLSGLLIGVVAVILTRTDTMAHGLAYAGLGWSAVLAVGLLARRLPGPAVLIAGSLAMAADLLQPIPPFALLPLGVAVALAVVRGAWVWAVCSVGAAYAVSLAAVIVSADQLTAARGFGSMVILLVALGGGAFLRGRQVRRQEEARRAAERQRSAIEEERLRIARELHDVLAHALSSINVQAGVGLHLAAARPAAATEALEAIRGAGREALQEVRGVLGLLRGDDAAPLTPGPDLDALGPLVEATRRTGARVALRDGLRPRPGQPTQLAVYRVVQESLTNARRHAPGAAVEIVLMRDGGAVGAVVRDRGAAGRPPQPVDGNGITGMRERAAALGGTLTLTTHDDGLEVALRIPEVSG